MKIISRTALAASLFFLCSLAGHAAPQATPTPYPTLAPVRTIGTAAPNIVFRPYGAIKTMSLHSLRGKWVYLNFFASWCGPCRQEFPGLLKDYAIYKSRVTFVALDEVESDAKALAVVREFNIPYLVAADPRDLLLPKSYRGNAAIRYFSYGPQGYFGMFEEAFHLATLPVSVLIDEHGIIRATWIGYQGKDELRTQLRHFGVQ